MSAVVDLITDVVGGLVEAAGDVVESVVDVVEDVAKAVDTYVIQPILDDPLSAIATVAAATFLGPAAAAYFGTSASVGVGLAAAAGNTAAGLVQGEDFDDAVKGGLTAGLTAGLGAEFFGGSGAEAGTPAPTDALDDFLAANNNFADVQVGPSFTTPEIATTSPVNMGNVTATELPPLGSEAAATNIVPEVTPSAAPSPLETAGPTASATPAPATTSPLQSLNTTIPQVEMPTFSSGLDTSFNPNYDLTSGMKPDFGLRAPKFNPGDSLDIYGNVDYSLSPKGISGGPGLQLPDAPNLTRMGGGQGITADFQGLPQYMENGVPTTFQGANGQTYGAPTPDVTVSSSGITPTPQPITYGLENMGTPSLFDQVVSGDLTGAAKNLGGKAVDWYKAASPWEVGAAGLGAASLLSGAGGAPRNQPPAPPGSTQDKNFKKSLDLYEFMRDRANYNDDLAKYGQAGQTNPGEHQFFQNSRFVPIPIPAKMGGLIQMKHFAQGGMAQGMQDPRRAQMMAAMAQQHPAGQGGPMGMAQGRPQMAPGRQMPQQGGPQGMQRPQAPQRPRDPKMAYYQYGNAPVQAKAMGGLSHVQSMRIGGGADGRSDDVNAVLSDGEYVMDAETVAMLGNGSSKAGAKKLDDMRSNLRQHKGRALSGGNISPNAKSPLGYLKKA
jgi:hypothetical protein